MEFGLFVVRRRVADGFGPRHQQWKQFCKPKSRNSRNKGVGFGGHPGSRYASFADSKIQKTSVEEREKIFKARQADSTKRNTTWAVNIFQEWNNERYGCDANMLEISVEELAKKLEEFYAEAKPKPKRVNKPDHLMKFIPETV
ncbi:hypothetical protein KUTeg_019815 [Tegillarca granosa]|uniref:Uncharacterized protein n=1 Tax=Tegillarca granosa TaxID=220873 RepID=A0ABQ9EFL7_TEGGR|nr:hypothetical protein KUTeg_019815 [Tegillarca granosa]